MRERVDMRSAMLMVETAIEQAIKCGRVVKKSWLVDKIAGAMAEPKGADAGFDVFSRHHTLSDLVGRAMRRRLQEELEPDEAQQKLPGYERLLTAYSITRDGEAVYVPTAQITNAEWEVKCEQYVAAARGLVAHELEIRRYMATRPDPGQS